MTRRIFTFFAPPILLFALLSPAHALTQHVNKVISLLEVPASTCVFFQLEGVTEADPVVPNSPWFAIDMEQTNGRALYAVLLSARTTGSPLARVLTNGQVVCGQSQVLTIDF